jgi:chromosome segregation ATPase
MSHSHGRQRVAHYLATHGPIEDPSGRATAKLREALGYEGSEASFAQLISNMDRAGQLTRQIKGKRTYRIVTVETASAPTSDPEKRSEASDEDTSVDYDELAAALLVQVVQALNRESKVPEVEGSWARRRIERLERRLGELERDLLASKAEAKTLAAERDQLRLQLEHSESNLALLTERLSAGKSRDGVNNRLHAEDRALLQRLRNKPTTTRPDRAS